MLSRRHIKQFFSVSISALAKSGSPLVVLFVSARSVSLDEFSQLAFGFLIFNLAQVVLDLGYQVRLPKSIAAGESALSPWFGDTLALKIAFSIFVGLVAAIAFWLTLGEKEGVVSIEFLLAGICCSLALHFLYVLRGLFNFIREALTFVTTELVTLSVVIAICRISPSAVNIALGFLGAKVVQATVAALVVWPRVHPLKLSFHLGELWAAMPYAIQTVVGAGFLLVDGVIVKGFVNSFDFSVQQMFVRLATIGCFLLAPAQVLLVSHFSRIAALDRSKLRVYVWVAATLLACVSALFLALYWFYDDEIVRFLLGDKFLVLAQFSWLLVAIVFIRYFCIPFGVVLSVSGNQAERAKVLTGAFVFLIALDFLLIPQFGIVGAFAASLVAHLALSVTYVFMTIRSEGRLGQTGQTSP